MKNREGHFRILHVITRLDLGGSAENTLLTVIGLSKEAYKIDLICGQSDNPPSENENRAAEGGVTLIRMKSLVRDISPIDDIAALFKLYIHMLKNRYDLVHTHTSKAGILGRIAAKMAGVRNIVHTPHGHIFYGYFAPQLTKVFVFFEWLIMRFTSAQITLTNQEKKDYLAKGIGPAGRIHPIYSGIDLSPFLGPRAEKESVRKSLGLERDHFVAGTVARLVPVKNHDLIVSAAAKLSDRIKTIRFVFAGDGELKESLQKKIDKLNMTRLFIFTGWKNNIPDILSAFDIFVMCSKNEGMGRAFVEAQAAGLPVIGSNVGGIPEVLDNGKTGYLVKPDDPDDLAEKIEMMYNRRGELKEMSDACRQWACSKFSEKVMVKKIDDLYRSLLYGQARHPKEKTGKG